MEVILKMTVTMIFMGTWTWTKNREMKEKVGVALRNNFVRTGRAPKGLRHRPCKLSLVPVLRNQIVDQKKNINVDDG